MTEKTVTVRLHFQGQGGKIEDAVQDFDLSAFGGVLPAVGDRILNPGVLQGRDRREPENREIWTVVGRMFNPRDNKDYIALIVEERAPTPDEYSLLPSN